MKHLDKTCLITNCNQQCPFWYHGEEGGFCLHPFFDNKPYGSNQIILGYNNKQGIPKECPLIKVSVTITTKLK